MTLPWKRVYRVIFLCFPSSCVYDVPVLFPFRFKYTINAGLHEHTSYKFTIICVCVSAREGCEYVFRSLFIL